MKLKDGHTYITRTGLKRVVKQVLDVGSDTYPFKAKATKAGHFDTFTENGRFLWSKKTPYDFVKEFKRAK